MNPYNKTPAKYPDDANRRLLVTCQAERMPSTPPTADERCIEKDIRHEMGTEKYDQANREFQLANMVPNNHIWDTRVWNNIANHPEMDPQRFLDLQSLVAKNTKNDK